MSNLTRWQRASNSVWPTFGGFLGLRNELDRLFEASFNEVAKNSAQVLGGWNPVVDVYDRKEAFEVKVELPGLKKEDIQINLQDGTLIIGGERKMEREVGDSTHRRSERRVGRFQRTISLPSYVNAAEVTAQYKDGILTVRLPKTEEAKPRQIDVTVN